MANFKNETDVSTSTYTTTADSRVSVTLQNATSPEDQVVLTMTIDHAGLGTTVRTLSLTSLWKNGSVWTSGPEYLVKAGTIFTITSRNSALFHADWTEVGV